MEHGRDIGLALAGRGAPCVSEFAVIELAAALGMTTDACRRYVGHLLEVRTGSPSLARVTDEELPWWRAARIADHTTHLPAAGAAHVDHHLAPVAAHGRRGADREAVPGSPRPVRPRRSRGPTAGRIRRPPGRRSHPRRGPHRHRGHHRDHRPGRRPRPRERGRPRRRRARRQRIHRATRRTPVEGPGRDRPPLPRRRPQHQPPVRAAGQAPPGDHQRAPPRPSYRPLRHHPRPDLGGPSPWVVRRTPTPRSSSDRSAI